MHISLFNICENGGGGGSMHPLKNYGGFCVIPLNAFNYITIWQTAIILYLGFLEGLISHFQKLGQRDLNKKDYIKICKKLILNFLYTTRQISMKFRLDAPLRRVI